MRFKPAFTVLLLVLAACASAPDLHYYTLDMTRSGRVETKVNLVVESFRTSQTLERSQIVIQHSPTRIDFYATDRWAASVGEMVRKKLAVEFGPPVDGRRTLIVSGKVIDLDQVDAGAGAQARATLEVEVRESGTRSYQPALLEKTYQVIRTADAAAADEVVKALSRAVEEIAAEIAADAARL
jgi:uncharacterized lipoprotein YmbA